MSGLQGTACYEIVSPASDRGSILTSIASPTPGVASTQPVQNLQYAFGFYEAPTAFNDGFDSRQLEVEFTFTPAIGNGNTTRFRARTTIVRPPVLLLHGIWSNSGTWAGNYFRDDARRAPAFYTTYAANYKKTNDASFSVNAPHVKDYVAQTIENARAKGYAVTKADVIGHSMGGLLTRLYIGGTNYKRVENLNKGDIRRLVTLDTPHLGTNFANLIVALYDDKPDETEDVVRDALLDSNSITNGAVCDMAENSQALAAEDLRSDTPVPAQVITATGGPAVSEGQLGLFWNGSVWMIHGDFEGALTEMVCRERNLFFQCVREEPRFRQNIVDGFRFREGNDLLVSISSQRGELTGTNFPKLIHFSGTGEGVTEAQDVVTRAFQLLDGQESDLATLRGLKSDGRGTPRFPVAGLDEKYYERQCIGGPLKPASTDVSPERQASMASATPGKRVASLQALTADARLRVISPVEGQQFAPGDTLTVLVEIVPPLTANDVAVSLRGLARVKGTNYNGMRYEASFVIPQFYAGPLSIVPAITDTDNKYLTGPAVTVAVRPTTAPQSLSLAQRNYHITLPTNTTESLQVTGLYADGVKRDLSSSASGTTYQSSNTAVVTVDGEGNWQPVGPGRAVITVDNAGLRNYATFVLNDPTNPLPPDDVTGQVSIQRSGFRVDRQNGFFVQEVTVTNTHPVPVVGPLFLVIGGLSNGVELVNKAGVTNNIQPVGSSYFRLRSASDAINLLPGQSVSLVLQFLNADRVRIDYLAKVFSTEERNRVRFTFPLNPFQAVQFSGVSRAGTAAQHVRALLQFRP